MPPAANDVANAANRLDGFIGDGAQFARDGKSMAGSITSDRMPRVGAMLAATAPFEYSVAGFINALGYPSLRARVDGQVIMACQRCLAPVEVIVAVDAELEMRETLAEIEGATDDVDRILAGKSMDVGALVEDEILLELPMVARHEACEPANVDPSGAKRPSPFAALAKRGQP